MPEEDGLQEEVRRIARALDNMRTGYSLGRRWADQAMQRERQRWALYTVALVIAVTSWFLVSELKDVGRELRILQLHVQDTGAVLIREGIAEPGDFTMGPIAPTKETE